jgi:Uma2 family endonuclease
MQRSSIGLPSGIWIACPAKRCAFDPLPQETLLIIEVSDSTITFDSGEKAQLYAHAGIREYWIIDIQETSVIVHSDPSEAGYASVVVHRSKESIRPAAYPSATLSLAWLFELT